MLEAEEKKPEFWSERIFHQFSKRFYRATKTEWIPFLAGMDDQQACGSYKDMKSRGYCLMLRDWAAEQMKENSVITRQKHAC